MIVNIRGCNGSGKSTIPMSMMDDPQMYVIEKPYKGKPKKIATVFPTYGWIALGSYHNKTGGLDGFPTTDFTKKVFWYVLKKYPEYNVILEGIMASTVYSTYAELFKQAENKYPDVHVIIFSLLPPLEVCLKRIQKRNGGKPIKEDLVAGKYKTVERNATKFLNAGFQSITWDNSVVEKSDMLDRFFEIIEVNQ